MTTTLDLDNFVLTAVTEQVGKYYPAPAVVTLLGVSRRGSSASFAYDLDIAGLGRGKVEARSSWICEQQYPRLTKVSLKLRWHKRKGPGAVPRLIRSVWLGLDRGIQVGAVAGGPSRGRWDLLEMAREHKQAEERRARLEGRPPRVQACPPV